jgi:hypothetical protein
MFGEYIDNDDAHNNSNNNLKKTTKRKKEIEDLHPILRLDGSYLYLEMYCSRKRP